MDSTLSRVFLTVRLHWLIAFQQISEVVFEVPFTLTLIPFTAELVGFPVVE